MSFLGQAPADRDAPGHGQPAASILRLSWLAAYPLAYAGLEGSPMADNERHVRLFRNGRNQALRIPREFELEGDEAILRKEGGRLIIEPLRKGRLLVLLASLEPLEEAFPDVDQDLAALDDVEL